MKKKVKRAKKNNISLSFQNKMTWCKVTAIVLSLLGLWYGITGQPSTRKMLLIAAVMSGVWVTFYNYDYICEDQIKIGRLNLMTFVAWTCGLLAVGFWWQWLSQKEGMSTTQKLLLTGVLWTAAIMAIEYVGYNWMNIQLKSDYTGLFGLKLMHGPPYLKVYYLSAWAIFLYLAFSARF